VALPFCRNCGKEYTNPNAQFCPHCGKPVQATMTAPTPTVSPAAQVKYCQKCGTANVSDAVACKNCGNRTFDPIPTIKVGRPSGVVVFAGIQIFGALVIIVLGALSGFFAAVLLPIGVLTLLAALALFTGQNWARILILIFGVLEIITIAGIIFGPITLWYFRKPDVVAYFKQPK
jgi:ribosomal protein L37E